MKDFKVKIPLSLKKSKSVHNSPNKSLNKEIKDEKNSTTFFNYMLKSSYFIKQSQLDWYHKLRIYPKINHKIFIKNKSLSPPHFYNEDLEKYKKKKYKIKNINKKKNLEELYHFLHNKSTEQKDKFQFQFATTLRNNNNFNNSFQNKLPPWKNLVNSKTTQNLEFLNKLLPPLLKQSKINLKKLNNNISHPLTVRYNKIEMENGETINKKIFDYDLDSTLRFPSGLNSLSKYDDDYYDKNFNTFRENFINADLIHWKANLRNYRKFETEKRK